MKINNLVFIDVESANSTQSSVCQISLIRNNDIINELVNPHVKFDFHNKKIHGIDEFKIKDKLNFKEVFLDKFDINDKDLIIVGHNVAFDVNVIVKDSLRYDVKIPNLKTICTHEVYVDIYPELPKHTLDYLCERFEIKLEKHHDAYSDALACKQLFEKAFKDSENWRSYVKNINFNYKNKIIYDTYSDLDLLRVAISIKVYEDLKISNFHENILNKKIQKLFNEFDYLMTIKNKRKNINNYIDCIQNSKYADKTKALIYLKVMLSCFVRDNKIDELEINFITNWLKNLDPIISCEFPFKKLLNNVNKIFEDNIISFEESNEIILWINKYILLNEDKTTNSNIGDGPKENTIFNKLNNIDELNDKSFCLTGDFNSINPRHKLSNHLKTEYKMKENNGVSSKTNYLIVGSRGSDLWAYGNYGGKIKNAISIKEKNLPNSIKIISEEEINKFIKID